MDFAGDIVGRERALRGCLPELCTGGPRVQGPGWLSVVYTHSVADDDESSACADIAPETTRSLCVLFAKLVWYSSNCCSKNGSMCAENVLFVQPSVDTGR